jgi:hypothetical protein
MKTLRKLTIRNFYSLVLAAALIGTGGNLFGAVVFSEDFNDNDISDWTIGSERFDHPFGTPDILFDPVAAGGVVTFHAIGSCFSPPFDGLASTLTKTITLPNGTYTLSYDASHSTHHYDFCQGGTGGDSAIFINGVPISPVSCTVNQCQTCTVPLNTLTGCFTVTTGSVEIKLRLNAGDCADSTGVFDNIVITAATQCPLGRGFWLNNPDAWPVNSLSLGTVIYTQEQLLAILSMPTGSGNKADASLILAAQLIAAKLSIANGSDSCPIQSTIAAADALIGGRTIPIVPKVTPNTGDGPQMVSLGAALDQYNSDALTPGCTP